MDKQEAKLILSSYSLGNEPKDDERFAMAKRIVESDAELSSWWTKLKEADRAIAGALQQSAVPEDLQSALNATVREHQKKRLRLVRIRKWASIAAAFALGSYLYFAYGIDRSDDYEGPLAQRAYQYSVDGPRLSYFDRDTANLRQWLVKNGFPVPRQLPPKLLDLEGIGCRPLNWSEERVALMCFNAETVYHLFIGLEKDFPEFDASEQIGYDQRESGWTVSKWTDDEYLFVLTAKATPDQIANYLASYEPGDTAGAL